MQDKVFLTRKKMSEIFYELNRVKRCIFSGVLSESDIDAMKNILLKLALLEIPVHINGSGFFTWKEEEVRKILISDKIEQKLQSINNAEYYYVLASEEKKIKIRNLQKTRITNLEALGYAVIKHNELSSFVFKDEIEFTIDEILNYVKGKRENG